MLGGFPNLSQLVWYNCFGSKYDLTQERQPSAAASYLECGSLLALSFEGLLLFPSVSQSPSKAPLASPDLRKKKGNSFRSYVNSQVL